MVIDLTDSQRAFVEAVTTFCQRECGTQAQRDALTTGGPERHSRALYQKMADLGWLGVSIPAGFDGSTAPRGRARSTMLDTCLFLETTSRAMAPISGFTTSAVVAAIYDRFGSPRQKETVLGGLALGEVETIARSEPDAGWDLAGLACRAEPRNGGFLVNGENTFCSNADIADRILLIARTSGTPGGRDGVTMFQVPAHADGLTLRPSDTMGGRDAHDLIFKECFLPDQAVVGSVGRGWRQLMAGLNIERLVLAATMLGTAQRAFDDTLAHVKQQRRQFGRPIGSFQVVRHRLADLATEIECCRLLVYRTAALVDNEPARMHPREASMAKLKTAETAKRVVLEGIQMLGGSGYTLGYDMDRHVRTTLLSAFLDGTSDIQREAIGRVYGL